MNKFSNFYKSLSTEEALYIFNMFGNMMMLVAILGGFSKMLPFAIAAFVFFAGLIAAFVAGFVLFAQKDFFIRDIVD